MRRPAWLSVRWWSSRSILTVSFCAFAAVLCILLGSNRYMADCVQQEAQAKDELASLIALGQQLADASDLLTNEVRAYAETEVRHIRALLSVVSHPEQVLYFKFVYVSHLVIPISFNILS